MRGPCEHDRDYTVACFFVKLCIYVNHDERMNPIDFWSSEVKGQGHNGHNGNKLVNKIETKLLCISLSNLAEMFSMVRAWTLLILEGQRSKVKVTIYIYGNKLVNTIATKPLCVS